MLVNGVAISQAILRPRDGSGKETGKEKEEQTKYTLDIHTQDANMVQRTDLAVNDEDFIWIYARVICNKQEIDTESITRALAFTREGPDSEWLVLGESRMVAESKVIAVKARPPFPDAELTSEKATVAISASIEGNQIRGPVNLTLFQYQLVVA